MSDRQGWIESPAYDLGLLILPLLSGPVFCALALRAPAYQEALVASIIFVLGMPHYLSSYTFYLDDANRTYYRTRAAAFYLGPVIIVLLLAVCQLFRVAWLVGGVVIAWNAYHVARQSNGILAIYRHLGSGDHVGERRSANLALLGLNTGVVALALARHSAADAPFAAPGVLLGGASALLAMGAGMLGVLIRRMATRALRPAPVEWIFLGASVLLFSPYLLVADLTLATQAMLAGHFVQYLGLIWLLNRRKYRTGTGSRAQRALVRLSQSLGGLLVACGVVATASFLFYWVTWGHGARGLHAFVIWTVVLLHFYVDGLCWALRHPQIRGGIAQFLLLSDRRRMSPTTAWPARR